MATDRDALRAAIDALEEIALAGMSGSGQESEEGMRDWHARQAWKFIGIAARALEPARAALAAPPVEQQAAEPDFWTACAWIEGGGEAGWIPLPGYSNETAHGVKNLVLEAARKEGYKGTVTGRLMELGWEVRPVYLVPQPAPQAGAAEFDYAAVEEHRQRMRKQVREDAGHPTEQPNQDAERLDFIEAHPGWLRKGKRHWVCAAQYSNYDMDAFKTAREAIDAARAAQAQAQAQAQGEKGDR